MLTTELRVEAKTALNEHKTSLTYLLKQECQFPTNAGGLASVWNWESLLGILGSNVGVVGFAIGMIVNSCLFL